MKRKEFAIKFQGRKATFLSTLTLMFCFLFLASYPVNAGQLPLTITPDRLDVSVEPYGVVTSTLTISNTGQVTVTWEMKEHSCSNPQDISWVEVTPITGTLPAADTQSFLYTFNAAAVSITDTNVFTGNTCLRYNPDVNIPISMTINQPPIPTLTDWGMILMVALLGVIAVFFIRKRKAV